MEVSIVLYKNACSTCLLRLPSKPGYSLWENVLTITLRSHFTPLRFPKNRRALIDSNKASQEHPGVGHLVTVNNARGIVVFASHFAVIRLKIVL